MKNLWKVTLWAIALLSVLFVLGSCGDDEPEETPDEGTHTCAGVSWVTEKEATCTAEGSKKFVCSCGKTVKTEKIPLSNHTEQTVPGKAATCKEKGLTDGKKCSVCGTTLVAQTEIPIDSNAHNMVNGVCTECYYPYIVIRTADDLKNISSNLSANYILMNDLDLGGMEWTPIGTDYDNSFTGTFDGNGHVIENFKITGNRQYAGLFGYSQGMIQNIGLENFTIDVSYSGSSYGVYAGGLVVYNYGAITKSYATGDVSASSTDGSALAGGLVGTNFGTITNCYATGDVSASNTSANSHSYAYAGGLVGYNYGSNATITNCYATGDVSASSTSTSYDACAYAGGLVVYNSGTITNCYAMGDVSASASSTSMSYDAYAYAGGLVGRNYNAAITNCYRYSGQSFTVTVNGTTTYSATNTEGAATSIENLQSKAWVEENLWKTEIEIWSFGFGYPALDYDAIETPIEISTTEELLKLQGEWIVRTYKLMADIDLGGMEWQPIAMFLGTFDGNGHVIENFKITGDVQYAGLFGYSHGTIQNLGIENFTIDVSCFGNVYAGGLVGRNSSNGTITNCYATGDVSASSTYDACAGGLVGCNDFATITNSYATGDVIASSTSYDVYARAGGLVGVNFAGTITNCYATGDISASASSTSTSSYDDAYAYAGGLVGINDGGTITNCYRYSGQSFTVTKNGTTTYEATNTEGTAADMSTLQSVDFQQNTLGWSADDWSFTEGAHPTLKNVGFR